MSKAITNDLDMDQPFYVRKKPDPVPFHKVLYNSEKGTVLGRTGTSWGKHTVSLVGAQWPTLPLATALSNCHRLNTHTKTTAIPMRPPNYRCGIVLLRSFCRGYLPVPPTLPHNVSQCLLLGFVELNNRPRKVYFVYNSTLLAGAVVKTRSLVCLECNYHSCANAMYTLGLFRSRASQKPLKANPFSTQSGFHSFKKMSSFIEFYETIRTN